MPQAKPVPETRPLVSVCRQLLAVPVMEFKVNPPVMVVAPLIRASPKTPKVVEGVAIPIPTRPSLALTTRVEVSTIKEWAMVEEAVVERTVTVSAFKVVTVEEELTIIPTVVEGVINV